MRIMLQTGLMALGLLALVSCAQPVEAPDEGAGTAQQDVAAINDLRRQYSVLYNAGDAEGLAALYTEDAVLMSPNAPSMEGRAAILAELERTFAEFSAQHATSSDEIQVAGEWAFGRGTYDIQLTPQAGGDPIQENGKYIVILQRQPEGSWRISRLIFNSNAPPPAAGA